MMLQLTYLVCYADPFDDLKECLTQSLTIVSIAELRKADKATFELPL